MRKNVLCIPKQPILRVKKNDSINWFVGKI